jgi:hypothetical protein
MYLAGHVHNFLPKPVSEKAAEEVGIGYKAPNTKSIINAVVNTTSSP